MIKLTAKNDSQHAAWYFKKMKHCQKFMEAFENYGARINWNNPIEADSFPEMNDDDFNEISRKPKKRAKDDLNWAFNSYLKDNPECDISAKIADKLIEKLSETPFIIKN